MNVKHVKFAIAGGVLLSAFLFLMLTSFQSENLAYFLTVDEIAAKGQTLNGRGVRVEGKLVPKSLKRNRETMTLAFRIQGENTTLPISYIGVPPDLLENGFPVIAEGKIDTHGVLVAKNLMVACPSKFEEMEKTGEAVPDERAHLYMIENSKKTEAKTMN